MQASCNLSLKYIPAGRLTCRVSFQIKQKMNPKGLSLKSTAMATMLPGCAGSLFPWRGAVLMGFHPWVTGLGGFWKGEHFPGDAPLGYPPQTWHRASRIPISLHIHEVFIKHPLLPLPAKNDHQRQRWRDMLPLPLAANPSAGQQKGLAAGAWGHSLPGLQDCTAWAEGGSLGRFSKKACTGRRKGKKEG